MTKEKEIRDREKKEKARIKREKKGREKRKIFGVNSEGTRRSGAQPEIPEKKAIRRPGSRHLFYGWPAVLIAL
jgi:hypothetical protein